MKWEAVAGWLYLTNPRLFFKSHAVNIQTHSASYNLEDIVAVRPRTTLGLVPNGMAVLLRDGREEKFVVNERKDWMSRILAARALKAH